MIKINLKNLRVFKDVAHKVCEVKNIKDRVANDLYNKGQGIGFHSLALKIYNSDGEIELDDREYELLMTYAKQLCSPAEIDALRSFKENV